jgi:hypothetical protein
MSVTTIVDKFFLQFISVLYYNFYYGGSRTGYSFTLYLIGSYENKGLFNWRKQKDPSLLLASNNRNTGF